MIKQIAIATFCVGAMLGECYALDISTGYKYSASSLYPAPPAFPGNSSINDEYWIVAARFDAGVAVTTPALPFVIDAPTSWSVTLAGSRWIGPRQNVSSPPGTSLDPAKRSLVVYRKCFCIINSTIGMKMDFNVKADDTLFMYFNSLTNVVISPTDASYTVTSGIHKTVSANFIVGTNCIFAVVEDRGGYGGFDLNGSVTGPGLWPYVAFGTSQSFRPCDCPKADQKQVLGGRRAVEIDPAGEQLIKDIVADARKRLASQKGR